MQRLAGLKFKLRFQKVREVLDKDKKQNTRWGSIFSQMLQSNSSLFKIASSMIYKKIISFNEIYLLYKIDNK